jgi:hypothetical protein
MIPISRLSEQVAALVRSSGWWHHVPGTPKASSSTSVSHYCQPLDFWTLRYAPGKSNVVATWCDPMGPVCGPNVQTRESPRRRNKMQEPITQRTMPHLLRDTATTSKENGTYPGRQQPPADAQQYNGNTSHKPVPRRQ